MNHLVYITKADGSKELFEEGKLIESLKRVGGTDEMIDRIVEAVGKEIRDGMTTADIYSRAFKLLHHEARPVAVKYSLRRALTELGPNGFPFERFVAEIFKEWGYQTLTDQTVMGGCVPHEMDIVAWNDKKLIMVEAKFHNEFGIKSDVKVALYIKARFDDIQENTFDYGGKKRSLDEGWLITNTKFTDQAIHYGECKGLKMVGWNYPKQGNLEHIIEELHLHPFTCLASLSNVHKKVLLERGVILCRDISRAPHLLKEIGLDAAKSAEVLSEIVLVCGK